MHEWDSSKERHYFISSLAAFMQGYVHLAVVEGMGESEGGAAGPPTIPRGDAQAPEEAAGLAHEVNAMPSCAAPSPSGNGNNDGQPPDAAPGCDLVVLQTPPNSPRTSAHSSARTPSNQPVPLATPAAPGPVPLLGEPPAWFEQALPAAQEWLQGNPPVEPNEDDGEVTSPYVLNQNIYYVAVPFPPAINWPPRATRQASLQCLPDKWWKACSKPENLEKAESQGMGPICMMPAWPLSPGFGAWACADSRHNSRSGQWIFGAECASLSFGSMLLLQAIAMQHGSGCTPRLAPCNDAQWAIHCDMQRQCSHSISLVPSTPAEPGVKPLKQDNATGTKTTGQAQAPAVGDDSPRVTGADDDLFFKASWVLKARACSHSCIFLTSLLQPYSIIDKFLLICMFGACARHLLILESVREMTPQYP